MELRVLVTGASGFIGSHLVDYLVARGISVRALVRKPVHHLSGQSAGAVEMVSGSLLDKESLLKALNGVDEVYHLAAELKMGLKKKSDLYQTNVLGTRQIIEACLEKNIQRMLFCSSVGVLGDVGNQTADEECAPAPDDDYELSKYEAETLAIKASSRMHLVIIRPAWVYGPRDTRTLKLFRMVQTGKMFLLGDGRNNIHPVFVGDVVRGMHMAATADVVSGSIFHIAGPTVVSTRELLEKVAEIIGTTLLPLQFPLPLAKLMASLVEPVYKCFGREAPLTRGKIGFFIKNRVYSIDKAGDILGFRPEMDLDQGLKLTIQWYKDNHML